MNDHSGLGLLAWLRVLPRELVLVLCTVLLVATQAILGLLQAPLWTRVTAAVLIAVVAIASELDKLRIRHREELDAKRQNAEAAEAAEAKWLRDARDSLRMWPAPSIGDVDPYALGVARPAHPGDDTPAGKIEPYVARDIDERAIKRLRAQGVLLLVGTPASGVTRTAYELAKAEDRSRIVLVPEAPLGLKRAIDELDVLARLAPPTRLVLWLDRLDRFRSGGLTPAMLRRFREQSPGLRVVASIASIRYAAWAAEEPELAEAFGEPVVLERLPSPGELDRAEGLYPDIDFSEGIAAAFTATGSLLVRLRAGDSSCPFEPAGGDCALSRAVLAVAVRWAGTGTPRPLTTSLLAGVLQQRLVESEQPNPAHLDHCIEWATAPVPQGVSLLSRGTSDDGLPTISAHRGVAEVRIAEESTPDRPVWAAALTDAEAASDSEAIGRIGYHAHVRNFLDIAPDAWARITAVDEPATRWLEEAALFIHHHQPAAVILPGERLQELAEAAHGPDHPKVAEAINSLGVAWLELGEPAKARELHERALRIREQEFGPDHPDVAATLNNLGNAWRVVGEPVKARELYERALRIAEREFGPDHLDVAATLDHLGAAWTRIGDPGRARTVHERALRIMERELGPDHPSVAITLNLLGGAWIELSEPAKARDLFERALLINEGVFGPYHPNVAKTLDHLGGAWDRLGWPDKARRLHERALPIMKRAYGPDHPQFAVTLMNLANAWQQLEEPAKARELYEQVLRIHEREFGPDHPKVAATLDSLGNTWHAVGQPGKARQLHQKALSIFERAYGPDHPTVAITLGNLGSTWADLGDLAEARESYERAIRVLVVAFPIGHPHIAELVSSAHRVGSDIIVLNDGQIADPAFDDRHNGDAPEHDRSRDTRS